MFESKAGAYLSEAPFRISIIRLAHNMRHDSSFFINYDQKSASPLSLSAKYLASMNKLLKAKQSSLIAFIVSDN
jgi:hypothetical protein